MIAKNQSAKTLLQGQDKTLTLIDASSILYRAFFALPAMTSANGEPTQALFGFAKFLMKWRSSAQSSEHCLVAFDGREGKKRRAKDWPAYKAHRQKAPPELVVQMDLAPGLCRALGLPCLQLESEEADDLIASACHWGQSENAQIFIHSQDKDLLQLVCESVSVLATHKDQLLYDRKGVRDHYGVDPEQLGDWLALVGDASDNIPGVAGIGPKKATQLLQEFGNLENLLSKAAQVPGKIGEKLRESQDQARLSRRLVALFDDVNHVWEWKELKLFSQNSDLCRSLFQKWNFKSLLRQLQPIEKKTDEGEWTLFPPSVAPSALSAWPLDVIRNRAGWDQLVNCLGTKGALHACTFDEFTRIAPGGKSLPNAIGIAVDNRVFALDIQSLSEIGLDLRAICTSLFDNEGSITWFTDCAKDWYHLRLQQLSDSHPPSVLSAKSCFDVVLAGYLLQKSEEDLFQTPYRKKPSSSQVLNEENLSRHLMHLIQLAKTLPNLLAKEELAKLFEEIEQPLVPILALMEHWGILVDVKQLRQQRDAVCERLAVLEQEIWQACGQEFNLNSPKQLAQILFEQLKLSPARKIATGYSTDAAALENLRNQHPAIPQLLEYRMLEKLRSTYIDALPQSIQGLTGRIHPKFMQTVTATGRLSCQEPNLQNIPVRSEWGGRIRSAFIAQKGCSLLSVDYSQIELRLMAHFSEDAAMIEAFCQDRDIHALTAARIFGVDLNKVTKQQRGQAKTVNFAVIYGQQAFGLAAQLGISNAQAESFIRAYFARYPGVANYIQNCKNALDQSKILKTLYGRKRALKTPNSGIQKRLMQRLAINSPIQGTGADLMKIAMIEVQRQIDLRGLKTRMILQIHDELLFESPFEEIDALKGLCRQAMEKVAVLRVPLIVNVSVGNNWEEC